MVGDGGYGDVIQMLRFIPLLAEQAEKVILAIDAMLLPLVAELQTPVSNLMLWDLATAISLETFAQNDMPDYYVHIGALPFYCASSQHVYTPQIPYIKPPETANHVALSVTSRFKIGLVWAGDSTHANDHNRSMALADFTPVFPMVDGEFYALQTGATRQQLAQTGF